MSNRKINLCLLFLTVFALSSFLMEADARGEDKEDQRLLPAKPYMYMLYDKGDGTYTKTLKPGYVGSVVDTLGGTYDNTGKLIETNPAPGKVPDEEEYQETIAIDLDPDTEVSVRTGGGPGGGTIVSGIAAGVAVTPNILKPPNSTSMPPGSSKSGGDVFDKMSKAEQEKFYKNFALVYYFMVEQLSAVKDLRKSRKEFYKGEDKDLLEYGAIISMVALRTDLARLFKKDSKAFVKFIENVASTINLALVVGEPEKPSTPVKETEPPPAPSRARPTDDFAVLEKEHEDAKSNVRTYQQREKALSDEITKLGYVTYGPRGQKREEKFQELSKVQNDLNKAYQKETELRDKVAGRVGQVTKGVQKTMGISEASFKDDPDLTNVGLNSNNMGPIELVEIVNTFAKNKGLPSYWSVNTPSQWNVNPYGTLLPGGTYKSEGLVAVIKDLLRTYGNIAVAVKEYRLASKRGSKWPPEEAQPQAQTALAAARVFTPGQESVATGDRLVNGILDGSIPLDSPAVKNAIAEFVSSEEGKRVLQGAGKSPEAKAAIQGVFQEVIYGKKPAPGPSAPPLVITKAKKNLKDLLTETAALVSQGKTEEAKNTITAVMTAVPAWAAKSTAGEKIRFIGDVAEIAQQVPGVGREDVKKVLWAAMNSEKSEKRADMLYGIADHFTGGKKLAAELAKEFGLPAPRPGRGEIFGEKPRPISAIIQNMPKLEIMAEVSVTRPGREPLVRPPGRPAPDPGQGLPPERPGREPLVIPPGRPGSTQPGGDVVQMPDGSRIETTFNDVANTMTEKVTRPDGSWQSSSMSLTGAAPGILQAIYRNDKNLFQRIKNESKGGGNLSPETSDLINRFGRAPGPTQGTLPPKPTATTGWVRALYGANSFLAMKAITELMGKGKLSPETRREGQSVLGRQGLNLESLSDKQLLLSAITEIRADADNELRGIANRALLAGEMAARRPQDKALVGAIKAAINAQGSMENVSQALAGVLGGGFAARERGSDAVGTPKESLVPERSRTNLEVSATRPGREPLGTTPGTGRPSTGERGIMGQNESPAPAATQGMVKGAGGVPPVDPRMVQLARQRTLDGGLRADELKYTEGPFAGKRSSYAIKGPNAGEIVNRSEISYWPDGRENGYVDEVRDASGNLIRTENFNSSIDLATGAIREQRLVRTVDVLTGDVTEKLKITKNGLVESDVTTVNGVAVGGPKKTMDPKRRELEIKALAANGGRIEEEKYTAGEFAGQVKGYTYAIKDKKGNVVEVNRYGIEYKKDARGKLVLGADGKAVVDEYHEVMKDAMGYETGTLDKIDINYDTAGKEKSYQEILTVRDKPTGDMARTLTVMKDATKAPPVIEAKATTVLDTDGNEKGVGSAKEEKDEAALKALRDINEASKAEGPTTAAPGTMKKIAQKRFKEGMAKLEQEFARIDATRQDSALRQEKLVDEGQRLRDMMKAQTIENLSKERPTKEGVPSERERRQ